MSIDEIDRDCAVRPVAALAIAPAAVNLTRCSLVEISFALLEHERADAFTSTWPPIVLSRAMRELELWQGRNLDRDIVMTSQAFENRCCVLILHHRAKVR